MPDNKWARLLAYVTGLVNQKLLLQNEYLAAENRILRAHVPARLRLSDPERSTLAEIGKRLGRAALQQVACVAKPDTIFAWYRRLRARKFDGSKFRTAPGRPRIAPELEALIVRFVRENSGWGYDRIVGALANLGHTVSDQTVGNILRRYGIQRHVTLFHLPGDVCCPWDSLYCMNTTTELLEAALIGYEHQRQQPEEKNARRCASNWVVRWLPNTSVRHQGDDARCRQRQESGSPPHRRDVGPNGTRHSGNPGEDGDGPQCSSSNAS